ncbi:MAG: hypothetical protein K0R93_1050 [Anaerosolibacter sp.]|jgi:hypothetical protein|uniref:DUF2634 domain-containing protein n=1 Tax=Anaerosolibacter sp. TaxID=1872527 RepID=UPI0026043276|nr:DUF2634 domain-containing protein [Anaerosolibacter sp.]MDF2546152.1 hypothetical protein [Anaerosolibacter sp.]
MLPQIAQLEFNNQVTKTSQAMGKSFKFDFEKGDFVLKDGRVVKTENVEALKVWIEKVIRTEKFRFKIYEGTDYGITLEDLIGQSLPRDLVESELKRELKDALETHPMIQSLSNIVAERDGSNLEILIKVNMADGNSFPKEVSI